MSKLRENQAKRKANADLRARIKEFKLRENQAKRKPQSFKGVRIKRFLAGITITKRGFKFGDLCAVSTLMRWLVSEGELSRRTVLVEEGVPTYPGGLLDYTWVFEECANIASTSHVACVQGVNKEQNLWLQWRIFRELVVNGLTCLPPKSKPPERYMAQGTATARMLGLPNRYAMLLPLYDARYHQYRNGTIAWWHELLGKLSKCIPVLVTGPKSYDNDIVVPNGAFNGFSLDLPPMVTMAMIRQCSLFVGGETGLPVWASVLGVPVAATWAYWDPVRPRSGKDYRPIPLASPVKYLPLNGDVDQCVEVATRMYNKQVQHTGV